jgi:hypothetical protein
MTMEASVMMAESGGLAPGPRALGAAAELSCQDVQLLVLLADGLSSTIQVVAWAARQGLV